MSLEMHKVREALLLIKAAPLTAFVMLLFAGTAFTQDLKSGLGAIENEQYRKARQIFTGLVDANPAGADYCFYLGNVYYLLEKPDSAVLFYNKGVSVNAQAPLSYIGVGKLMLDAGNPEEAKKMFDKAQTLAPRNMKVPVWIAEAYITSKNGNAEKAIELLNSVLEYDGKDVDALILLGDASLLKIDGGGTALSSYERALEVNPAAAKAHLRIGQLYVKARNYDIALESFQKCLAADSTYVLIYRDLGELWYQKGKVQKAKEYYQKYMAMAEPTGANLHRYASFLFLAKDYSGAISVIEEVLKKDSSNAVMSRLIGYSYYEMGKHREGLAAMEKFFARVDSKKILASDYEYYGKILGKTGSDSLGIIYLRKAMELDTARHDLHGEVAQIYFQKKRWAAAAAEYELKIKLSSPTLFDYFFLGRCWYYLKDYVKADTAFATLTREQPESPLGHFWRGRANSAMDIGSFRAKPFYEKYIELTTDTVKYRKDLAEAHEYLGFYFVQNDDIPAARTHYEKALELDPENKNVKDALEQLKGAGH